MFLVETGESRTIPETRDGSACSYFLEWNQANQSIEHVVGPWTLTFKSPIRGSAAGMTWVLNADGIRIGEIM